MSFAELAVQSPLTKRMEVGALHKREEWEMVEDVGPWNLRMITSADGKPRGDDGRREIPVLDGTTCKYALEHALLRASDWLQNLD